IRAGLRLLLFTMGISFYLIRYFIKVPMMGMDLDRGLRLRKEFLRQLIPLLGVRIQESGSPPESPGIYVSNHRSYFDPVVVLARIKACPVAKAEVRNWPLIGLALKASGVFFVDRNNQHSRRRTRDEIGKLFTRGFGILIYPEGTTHANQLTIDFKKGVFKEASAIGASIYPIAIEYKAIEDAWIGDDTFFRHFFARFGFPQTNVRISYGPELFSTHSFELHEKARQWIDKELAHMQQNWSEFEYAS
ncbi:MAG: 1-acyl-sn-glycerol-3-phosphate acyltransferase, partial [Saprospiraceae bacterium]|nr:1-acyl-sn-glycerol-3-phosphate acyltransferase [Saprospiraceae bacterium]